MGKSMSRTLLQVFLELGSLPVIGKRDADHYFPRRPFRGVKGFACVVLGKTLADILSSNPVPRGAGPQHPDRAGNEPLRAT